MREFQVFLVVEIQKYPRAASYCLDMQVGMRLHLPIEEVTVAFVGMLSSADRDEVEAYVRGMSASRIRGVWYAIDSIPRLARIVKGLEQFHSLLARLPISLNLTDIEVWHIRQSLVIWLVFISTRSFRKTHNQCWRVKA